MRGVKQLKTLNKEKVMFGIETCILFGFILVSFFYRQTGFTLVHGETTCLLQYLTGYYCPACGGTRAFEALLHFQPLKSILYHPIVVFIFAVIIISWMSYIIKKATKGKVRFYPLKLQHLIYMDVILVVVFVLRNLHLYFWEWWFY